MGIKKRSFKSSHIVHIRNQSKHSARLSQKRQLTRVSSSVQTRRAQIFTGFNAFATSVPNSATRSTSVASHQHLRYTAGQPRFLYQSQKQTRTAGFRQNSKSFCAVASWPALTETPFLLFGSEESSFKLLLYEMPVLSSTRARLVMQHLSGSRAR
jgi:hypothetical protein